MPQILRVVKAGQLGLWIGSSEKRNVIPPPSDQRRTSVLFSVGQCLWKGFPLALWKQQDGKNRQQSQRRVDHVMQEVAVVITQIHQRRTQSAHATQSHDSSHPTSPADTRTIVTTTSLIAHVSKG